MTKVEVLASGSKGNAYLLTSGEKRILLDCGISYKNLEQRMGFELPDAVLVTHEHIDHAKAVKDFLNRGVDVFMTGDTANVMRLENRHNLQTIKIWDTAKWASFSWMFFRVLFVSAYHDAASPANFIVDIDGDLIFYITDTGGVSEIFDKGKSPIGRADPKIILIEANFDEENLQRSSIDASQKERIRKNHLSVNKAFEFLTERADLSSCDEIHLIHVSRRHGDGEKFREIIEAGVETVTSRPIKITAEQKT